jgi:hypothetical protein
MLQIQELKSPITPGRLPAHDNMSTLDTTQSQELFTSEIPASSSLQPTTVTVSRITYRELDPLEELSSLHEVLSAKGINGSAAGSVINVISTCLEQRSAELRMLDGRDARKALGIIQDVSLVMNSAGHTHCSSV